MAKYHLTNKAVEDLAVIWNYTFDEWSENQADKYYLLLLDSCQEAAENPSLGKKYDIVTEKLLGYKSNEHILFYQIISENEIEIVRILHGKMDLKSKF
ncbi:type II toxin-antitoxin system RelE/ParE family toxin [Flavobacterium johnsoniae]|uniref:Toxin n=1 Tax=Flavobacterium johnsoniae (strain ATCC 17061 / DSM 2064 / JCM 8514 / BCRC 14874 / CCUG 350202 / NBRC 14942 / NCIMB 11054 / UW101) TaxID=376686 RepID=A5FB90_FLAJ1|nr:type II toxin-antitoxin system RelE/ParE family toxin [Flavobacterium johnsoniae]ABQ07524.1 plasmid stabilization system [Flavobacterium johnsoniae UW101]OXE99425.1 plasmid stabilization protein [Flavobacterium johnsoniae UW101]WQG80638.1 type II toxin-antitoxin system RelE/ParE family toxin [Flavobacterium johnsoniae UW101]SHL10314.1 toxin ParE1/3/4 [Flavobacterium johnsoniae]